MFFKKATFWQRRRTNDLLNFPLICKRCRDGRVKNRKSFPFPSSSPFRSESQVFYFIFRENNVLLPPAIHFSLSLTAHNFPSSSSSSDSPEKASIFSPRLPLGERAEKGTVTPLNFPRNSALSSRKKRGRKSVSLLSVLLFRPGKKRGVQFFLTRGGRRKEKRGGSPSSSFSLIFSPRNARCWENGRRRRIPFLQPPNCVWRRSQSEEEEAP